MSASRIPNAIPANWPTAFSYSALDSYYMHVTCKLSCLLHAFLTHARALDYALCISATCMYSTSCIPSFFLHTLLPLLACILSPLRAFLHIPFLPLANEAEGAKNLTGHIAF
jgi:hypothetical protein